MKKVFVSGCYDVVHAGHLAFFEDAKALGDHLTVCFASADVLRLAKKREPAIPDDHKKILIGSFRMVDDVVTSSNLDPVLDFLDHIKSGRYDILAVTDDDKRTELKKKVCDELGMQFIVMPKRVNYSTTEIRARISGMLEVPLRVDFAGGWLDVPKFSDPQGFIVNCSISPLVSLKKWPYRDIGGLGSSAAYSILQVKNGVTSEFEMGAGWQDPSVISETGLCVWRSGKKPILDVKYNPDWLAGKFLLIDTGIERPKVIFANIKRDFKLIKKAGLTARKACDEKSLTMLAKSVKMSYEVQLKEGMAKLPKVNKSVAQKYIGSGWGGYALYLFKSKKDRDFAAKGNKDAMIVEPYIKDYKVF